MSRRPGRAQRDILDALAASEVWLSIRELACIVYGTEQPVEHQERAVRRAVAGLRARGLAQTRIGWAETRTVHHPDLWWPDGRQAGVGRRWRCAADATSSCPCRCSESLSTPQGRRRAGHLGYRSQSSGSCAPGACPSGTWPGSSAAASAPPSGSSNGMDPASPRFRGEVAQLLGLPEEQMFRLEPPRRGTGAVNSDAEEARRLLGR